LWVRHEERRVPPGRPGSSVRPRLDLEAHVPGLPFTPERWIERQLAGLLVESQHVEARLTSELASISLKPGGSERDERLAVAVLCNTDVPDVGRPLMQTADDFLADRLKQIVKPSLASGPKTARARADLSPERRAELPALAGVYHSSRRFAVWRLTVRDGRLFVTGADEKEQELAPIANGGFLLTTASETATVAFNRAASGARAEMTVQSDGLPSRRFEPVEEAARTPAKLAEFIGTYYSQKLDVTYTVILQDTMLVVRRQRRGDAPMIPMFADGFRVIDFGQMLFVRDHLARITGLYVAHWAGAIWNLPFVRRTPGW
jgi:hypothetical protein